MDVEWLILADFAQVVGNKVYVMGGGWDTFWVHTGFPIQHRFSVAVAFSVPWNETNQSHPFEIEIADEDGNTHQKIGGQLEIGRPAGIPPGQTQRAQAAAHVIMEAKKPGNYVIIANVDGQEGRRIPFRIATGPLLAATQRKAQQGGSEQPKSKQD